MRLHAFHAGFRAGSIAAALFLFGSCVFAADIPPETIAGITYDGMPDDRGIEAPFAKVLLTAADDPELAAATAEFRTKLARWKPAQATDEFQRLGNLLSLLALADLGRLTCESEAPLVVLGQLREAIPEPRLSQLLARCILTPGEMEPLLDIPEFDVREVDREMVRKRMVIYARKMLGRVLGKLPR
jgi:hypothetical protein